ncbi:MAG: type II toxin-antitoxin system RelB/DinJ family antitoxin [Rickettsiales bacterium]
MATNDVVRARIDGDIKEQAAVVLATMGLTVSDAFRIMMMRIATEKSLPFEPLIPNAETIAAMEDARAGRLIAVGHPDNLLASLNEKD